MNKFYGVTKINSRGQIVLPKTTRDDFKISSGDQLVVLEGILSHSKGAFLLMKADAWYKVPDDAPIKNSTNHEYVGMVKVAERGQIVIPKKLREKYNLNPKYQLLILSHEKTHSILIALLNEKKIGEWANKMMG
jgi:AbrB family looped-hinge helix DNA binding protein